MVKEKLGNFVSSFEWTPCGNFARNYDYSTHFQCKKRVVSLLDDDIYEMQELFYVRLGPHNSTKLGTMDSVAITVTDQTDSK